MSQPLSQKDQVRIEKINSEITELDNALIKAQKWYDDALCMKRSIERRIAVLHQEKDSIEQGQLSIEQFIKKNT